MKIVHGRADARWLPSRFNFALFRLYAFLRRKNAKPEPADVVLVIDRTQNPIESAVLSIWTTATLACYAAATLFASWPLPLGLLAGVPVAITCLEIPLVVVGVPLRRRRNNIPLNSFVMMSLLIAAAVYFARAQSWVRFAAWQFLAVVALNSVAAAIVFLLRGSIAEMERDAGGITSEL
ncbi:MAG: hypothetical protein ACXW28_03230 [Thermoanaerobaculia bacterium]